MLEGALKKIDLQPLDAEQPLQLRDLLLQIGTRWRCIQRLKQLATPTSFGRSVSGSTANPLSKKNWERDSSIISPIYRKSSSGWSDWEPCSES